MYEQHQELLEKSVADLALSYHSSPNKSLLFSAKKVFQESPEKNCDLNTDITDKMVRKFNYNSPKRLIGHSDSDKDILLKTISPSKLAAIHELTSPEKNKLYLKLQETGKKIDLRAKKAIVDSIQVRAEMIETIEASDKISKHYSSAWIAIEKKDAEQREAIKNARKVTSYSTIIVEPPNLVKLHEERKRRRQNSSLVMTEDVIKRASSHSQA